MENQNIVTLRDAVVANPLDVALRLRLGRELVEIGQPDEAVVVVAAAVALAPADGAVRTLLIEALLAATALTPRPPVEPGAELGAELGTESGAELGQSDFDWPAAEEDLGTPQNIGGVASTEDPLSHVATVRLSDVGGMLDVKARLGADFLAPLGTAAPDGAPHSSRHSGLLLYGPPGCGKTFIAHALAGELGARILMVEIDDVLDPYLGQGEQNLHRVFQAARREAPCVAFVGDLDTLGNRRSATDTSILRNVVAQLLVELDGFESSNDSILIVASTDNPWDVDPAMLRPGRFDRTLLVRPPDLTARASIFRTHLDGTPVDDLDVDRLASLTDGYSGADIASACESASELALKGSVSTGIERTITMADLVDAVRLTHPSVGEWLDAARTALLYGNDDGTYAELRDYLAEMNKL